MISVREISKILAGAIFALALFLSACTSAQHVPPATTAPIHVERVCIAVKDWPLPVQQGVADILPTLPQSVQAFLLDYKRMRDQARACAK